METSLHLVMIYQYTILWEVNKLTFNNITISIAAFL